jgi:hypothetical protein
MVLSGAKACGFVAGNQNPSHTLFDTGRSLAQRRLIAGSVTPAEPAKKKSTGKSGGFGTQNSGMYDTVPFWNCLDGNAFTIFYARARYTTISDVLAFLSAIRAT